MAKKQRFSIPEHLNQGFNETIELVEKDEGLYRNTIVQMDRITIDPENPRRLAIQPTDLPEGPRNDDPSYTQKKAEYEKLVELANSIRTEGLIHPIVVVKYDNQYQIIAGERRYLASIIAGKSQIEARVFNEKPTGFRLKYIQWLENNEREDLSLIHRIQNVKMLLDAYAKEHPSETISTELLSKIANISRPHALSFMNVIQAPKDIMEAVSDERISSLEKAGIIANVNDKDARKQLIERLAEGMSVKQLRQQVQQIKKQQNTLKSAKVVENRVGRPATRVSLGNTQNLKAVKALCSVISEQYPELNLGKQLDRTNWEDYLDSSNGFKVMLRALEKKFS